MERITLNKSYKKGSSIQEPSYETIYAKLAIYEDMGTIEEIQALKTIYCADCGAWQTSLNKTDKILAERFIKLKGGAKNEQRNRS